MVKKIFQLMLCICSYTITIAADGDYAIAKIPAALLEHANVIKRNEEIRVEVMNVNKVKTYRKVAYTVLNENGDKYVAIAESYDKLSSIPTISATLFDAMGVKVKSMKKADLQDLSATSDNSLADDNRMKTFNFYCRNYPYTVEYEVEQDLNYTMFYPRWLPVEGENMAVQSSSISVIMPADLHFRYKPFNYTGEPVKSVVNNKQVSTWQLQNYNAIEKEYAAPTLQEITPSVSFAPSEFGIQGYQGNMNSWEDFGKFIYALKKDRDVLPDNIKATVHQLTDNVKDTREKVALLYDFMQKNTRYISVQLGIGGWQPYDAAYVATKRYGDCKALSNYMYALLKEAGIPSYYTVVKAENSFFIKDFPSSQFNHVILCVPFPKDSIWLECTSQTQSPGFMGSFTGGHYALMVTEDGGKLVQTPAYKIDDNLQIRKINAMIDNNGNATIHAKGLYKAIQEEDLHSMINYMAKGKQLEHLKKQFDLPQYDVVSFDYKEDKAAIPSITENVELTANSYASVSGKRLFVMPNILSKSRTNILPTDSRKYDVVLELEYRDIDTVEIKIPEGYTPEAIPQPQQIVTKFGKYTSNVKVEDNKIIYYRDMQRYSGRFEPAAYNELVKFYEQIYKADRSKVVMVKGSSEKTY